MKILLTGALGRLGSMVAEQALAMGHELRCFDLDTKANRRVAESFTSRCEIRFGDLLKIENYASLLDGMDGVIHLAALLPPHTDQYPEMAERINVEATDRLIQAIAAMTSPPHLVYPSSLSVFAQDQERLRPRRADDPVAATDNYTRHKLAVESLLKEADIPWTILRVGVSVDARTLSADRSTFRKLLHASASTPVEWVHPKDVALAMCRCLEVPESQGRILLIGGGKNCQVSHATFMGTSFRAMGLRYPEQVHGHDYFYMHWLDTEESQILLQYQQHDFSDYAAEMHARLRTVRALLWPLRPLINPLLGPLLQRV